MNLDNMTREEIEMVLGPDRVREIEDAAVLSAVSDLRAGMLRSAIETRGEEWTGRVVDFRDLPGGLIVRLKLEDGEEIKIAVERCFLETVKDYQRLQYGATMRGIRQTS